MSTVKEVFDGLFAHVKFDKALIKKLISVNIRLMVRGDNKELFGGQLVGCYNVYYSYADAEYFFSELFDLNEKAVKDAIKNISTIKKNFQIARDSINLTCFYVAHRFLSNSSLNKSDKEKGAIEVLNYFNYRTLILLNSNYFIYPISLQEAVSLLDRLSYKYLIKKLPNWKEYCQYRSKEYLASKYRKLLISFNDDKALPNAINDLYLRTKDTMKNIYGEFLQMVENDEGLTAKKSVGSDLDGEDVLLDKLNSSETLYNNIVSRLSDKASFINNDMIVTTSHIIKNLQPKHLKKSLEGLVEYVYLDSKNFKEVTTLISDMLQHVIVFLAKNKTYLHEHNNVIKLMNLIVGNLLYARSNDKTIDEIKNRFFKLVKKVNKTIYKENTSDKAAHVLKNGFFVYILLRGLIVT